MDALGVISQANLSSEDEADFLEIPSFLESLASSASQLRELAQLTSRYYIRGLLSYGYIHEPKRNEQDGLKSAAKLSGDGLVLDSNSLESMSSLVDLLPFLSHLSGHIEKSFTTLEITFRRFNYHLNKSSSSAASKRQQPTLKSNSGFKPPTESRFDPVFVSIMDLLFAFISLDETIRSHTNISHSIGILKQTCQLKITNFEAGEQDISEAKIKGLLEMLRSIESTICDENRGVFHQCLEHLQHLDLILNNGDKNGKFQGRNISEHLDEFIVFYAENLSRKESSIVVGNLKSNQDVALYLLSQSNLTSTIFMTSLERKVLGLTSLFALNNRIFKKSNDNKKVTRAFNQMLTRFKRINLINLAESNIFIILSDFLTRYLPKGLVVGRTLNDLQVQDDQFLGLDLRQYLNETSIEVMSWLVKFKAASRRSTDSRPSLSSLQEHRILLEKGVSLIEAVNTTVQSTIAVHLKHRKATTRGNLVPLLRSVALLKSIQLAFYQNRTSILDQQVIQDRMLRSSWRKLMSMARKRSITSKYSDRKLDLSTSLILFGLSSNLIDRLATDCGRSILFMAVSMLSSSCFNEQELNDLNVLLAQMRPDIYETLGGCSNCAYLYWSVPTFSAYYNHVLEQDPGNIGEISYFHRAVDDIRLLFSFDAPDSSPPGQELNWLVKKRDQFCQRLGDELLDQFRSHTLDKVCQELEMELRLQTHRDLHLDGHNPFRRHLYNFKRIFSHPTDRLQFSLFGRTVSLKQYVEQHLSEIYYNLTSIAPHDWFSYDCMINLARQKYGLQLINSQMPTQTIECGIDLMEITRNLALFVSRYSYDMSNQLFVEKCSNRLSTSSSASVVSSQTTNTHSMLNLNNMAANQSLNVVQIRHVSMSIQNHGFGLLNSSINCTYQVMKRLVNLISRQTSDDRLRALLTKQHQQLSSCLVGSGISFEKALKLARKFKVNHQESIEAAAAGGSKEATSAGADLDQIRQSLTQLGNSLAFMRLLKSGALNCASKSVDYLPDLDDTSLLRLKKIVQGEFCRQQSSGCCSLLDAATNFDACLEDFEENFSPKTDYFSIVLSLFSEALGGEKQPETSKSSEDNSNTSGENPAELQPAADKLLDGQKVTRSKGDRFEFFHLLIPSLTINFIDYIINAKERVVSRSSANRVGALICDDGFSMGVAFLLIVLGKTREFAKLEWFKEVRTKLDTDKAEVQRRIGNSSYEESLKQTSSMTLRRLNRLRQEYDALNYNLKSALLLFRSSTLPAEPLGV